MGCLGCWWVVWDVGGLFGLLVGHLGCWGVLEDCGGFESELMV